MAITKITNQPLSSSNTAMILFPVGIVLLGLFLFIFIAPQSYTQIVNKFNASKEQKSNYENLQKKLSVLQSMSPTTLEQTSKVVMVLPDKNPILAFISQMKNLAIEKNIVINDIKSSTTGDTDSGAKKLEFEVTLQGESLDSIGGFLNDLTTRAPIVSLDQTTISATDLAKLATVKMSVYWAALPTTLPALTDPLPPFSSDELKTLDKMSAYTVSEFANLAPGNSSPRENPFN